MSSSHRRAPIRIFLMVSAAFIGLIGYSFSVDFSRTRQVDQEVAALEQEITTLQTRKVELSKLLRYVDSEAYAERRARLELGLAKPGEQVLVVPPQLIAQPTPDRGGVFQPGSPSRSSPLRAWWAYFFKRDN